MTARIETARPAAGSAGSVDAADTVDAAETVDTAGTVDAAGFVGSAEYPGRVVIVGRDVNGTPFAVYGLSGRSPASRQRDLRVADAELEVVDLNGAGDDPLRHYHAAFARPERMLLGNGDHVGELWDAGVSGATLAAELEGVLPEPDPPIWTPRIGALATFDGGELHRLQSFGVAGAEHGGELVPLRNLASVTNPPAGVALAVKTYRGSAAEVVTDGVPVVISVTTDWPALVDAVANSITPALRIGVIGAQLRDGGFAEWARA